MAIQSRILAWKIPWTEEPTGFHSVSKSWTQLSMHTLHILYLGPVHGRLITSLHISKTLGLLVMSQPPSSPTSANIILIHEPLGTGWASHPKSSHSGPLRGKARCLDFSMRKKKKSIKQGRKRACSC